MFPMILPFIDALSNYITTLSRQDILDNGRLTNWCSVTTGCQECPYLSRNMWMDALPAKPQRTIHTPSNPLISQSSLPPNLRASLLRISSWIYLRLMGLMQSTWLWTNSQKLSSSPLVAKTLWQKKWQCYFLNNVWKRFGLPDRIISDRGPQFTSQVTKEIWKTLGIEQSMSTAYHPQTDGETE